MSTHENRSSLCRGLGHMIASKYFSVQMQTCTECDASTTIRPHVTQIFQPASAHTFITPHARSHSSSTGMMSIAFSVNHGCVTALIAVASTVESKLYSGLVNGTLYTTYTLSSLLLANATLSKLGSKWCVTHALHAVSPVNCYHS